MPFTHPRLQRERQTIEAVMEIFCREQHQSARGTLCSECQSLQAYALQRLERCPFQENKSTCANCAVHCYKPEMRRRIRTVMLYAGPRMLLRHPILAVRHLLDGRREAGALKSLKKNL
jgi:predicted amidophosphoribosyltransferase